MTEPTSAELPAEPQRSAQEPAADDPEVVLHSADGDDGETPWCIGDMTAR
ncbi:hypothetical protein [Saccharothrix sp. ST-888]|nr:hypothetical protein [Saccharothrix sp. ST-888]